MLDLLEASKRMFELRLSPNFGGNYMTFLEMLNATDRCHFAGPNEVCQANQLVNVRFALHGNFHPLQKVKVTFQSYIQITLEKICSRM